jgi:hypothetical protein
VQYGVPEFVVRDAVIMCPMDHPVLAACPYPSTWPRTLDLVGKFPDLQQFFQVVKSMDQRLYARVKFSMRVCSRVLTHLD